MKTAIISLILCVAAAPPTISYSTKDDGWNYPQGESSTFKLMNHFRLDKNTVIYLDGKIVRGRDINIPGDELSRFKLDSTNTTFTHVQFVRPPKNVDSPDIFKLGGK